MRTTGWTRAHDLALSRYVRAQRDSVVIGTRLTLNVGLAGLRTDHQVAVAAEHNHLPRNPALRAEYADRYRSLDALAVLTEGDATAYRGVLNGACPVVAIPNALPLGTRLRRSPLREPVAVAAGLLTHRKGFDILVDAWRTVAETRPDWRLRIYGAGEERDALQRQVDDAGLTGVVTLEGFEPDLAARLDEASMFVLSSRREGMPMVVIEAMAAGLPIVAANCPTGPDELLDGGRFGVLVPPGASAPLADAHPARRRRPRRAAAVGRRSRRSGPGLRHHRDGHPVGGAVRGAGRPARPVAGAVSGRRALPWFTAAAAVGTVHGLASLYWALGGNALVGTVGEWALTGALGPVDDLVAIRGHAWLWDPLFLAWGLTLGIGLWRTRRRPSRVAVDAPVTRAGG